MSFYVYIYLDPTRPGDFVYEDLHFEFEPFYVGKASSKKRKKAHLFESQRRKDTNSHKINRIRAIQASGVNPIILEVFHTEIEKEAYESESKIIGLIGRRDLGKGPLTNKVDLQNGLSEESKKLKSKRLSQNNWITGVGHSLETRELMSQRKKDFLSKNPHPRLGKSSPGSSEKNSKPITLNGKTYTSIKEAMELLGLNRYFLFKQLKKESLNGVENS